MSAVEENKAGRGSKGVSVRCGGRVSPVGTQGVRGAVNERESAKCPESSLPGDRERTPNSSDVTDAGTARSVSEARGG